MTLANSRSCPLVRATSPVSRTVPRLVSESAMATSSVTLASRASATAVSQAARSTSDAAAVTLKAAAAAAVTAVRSRVAVLNVVSFTLRGGALTCGRLRGKVEAKAWTAFGAEPAVADSDGRGLGEDAELLEGSVFHFFDAHGLSQGERQLSGELRKQVRSHPDAVRAGQLNDPAERRNTAHADDVGLDDIHGFGFDEVAETIDGVDVLAKRDRHRRMFTQAPVCPEIVS